MVPHKSIISQMQLRPIQCLHNVNKDNLITIMISAEEDVWRATTSLITPAIQPCAGPKKVWWM